MTIAGMHTAIVASVLPSLRRHPLLAGVVESPSDDCLAALQPGTGSSLGNFSGDRHDHTDRDTEMVQ